MKKCKFKNNDLLNYCYGEANSRKAAKIKDHLVTCHQCSSKVEGFEQILSLAKDKKAKEIPVDILDNYTQEVLEKITKVKEAKPDFTSLVRERLSNSVENFKIIFSPKFVPVAVVASLLIFSFIFFQQSKINPVEAIDKEIALLEQLDEYTEEILLSQNGESLSQALDISDEINLAQLEEDVDAEDVFSDFWLLQELEEDVISDDISEDFDILDELELEVVTG